MGAHIRKKSKTEKKQIVYLIGVFTLGLFLHLIPATRHIAISLTEVFYFLINLVILSFIVRTNKHNLTAFFLWAIPGIFIIFILQVLSVNNNEFFGSFSYSSSLNHQIAGVPYIISFLWITLIFTSLSLSSKITKNNLLRILLAAFFVVLLDIILEPLGMKLGYWQWEHYSVPFQNYLMWFVISVVFSSALIIMKIEPRSLIGRTYFIIIFIFFTILRIAL